ncbi:uncharacterized protein [Gossypium hirsutum]|uniref:Retrotransposon gag domain-containing protein n=1 Tax=Gossypium hirsutum TaxID=3635 RepID=A0A1U8P6R5_GOSHI|nr:uncharacterized protein LOC107954743 [Gossypium hirsutum]
MGIGMSTRGTHGRGTRDRGRGRGSARVGSSALGHMPNVDAGEAPASPAMLQILERVARTNMGAMGRGSVSEQLWSNGAEIFRGISKVALNVADYWLEATERIMDDLNCTSEEKLKGKYVGASYVDARRREFLSLTQGNRSVAEYEAEFLRLSCYARGILATKFERCVSFEDSLRDELRVLIVQQRGRDFTTLVEKAKITKDVKRSERENRKKDKGRYKRDLGSSGSFGGSKNNSKFDGPVRVGVPVARSQHCLDCRRHHLNECWKKIGPVRGVQLPPRVRGLAKGGNGMGRGRGVPGRGASNTEARQPALLYAARR